MYNEKIKEQFVNDCGNSSLNKGMFERYGELEEKHERDLYYIPYDVIANEIFEVMTIRSYDFYRNTLNRIKRYKQWCMINKAFPDDVPMNSTRLSSKKLKETYGKHMGSISIKSFMELHECMDPILGNDASEDYMGNAEIVKMTYLLLYQGIPEVDVFKLTTSDVIFAQNALFIKNNDIIIQVTDNGLRSLLEKRIHVATYGCDRGHSYRYFPMGDLLVSFGGKSEFVKKQVQNSMNKARLDYGEGYSKKMDLQLKYIYFCGIINKVKLDETINGYKIKKNDLYDWFEKKYGTSKLEQAEKIAIERIYATW